MDRPQKAAAFELIGGRACLDFANTLGGKRGAHTTEKLTDHAALLRWAAQASLISRAEAKRLAAAAALHPQRAAEALADALTLRETLHALFDALAHHRAPPAGELSFFNSLLSSAHESRRLVHGKEGFSLAFADRPGDLAPFLRLLALDAADLLISPDARLVRVCAEELEDRCDWVFLDTSRGAKRRFCSMADCGNRAKQRRFYRRAQAGRSMVTD